MNSVELSGRSHEPFPAFVFILLFLTFSAFAPAAKLSPPQDPELAKYIWNLTPLYVNNDAWEAERNTVLQKIETIGRLKGTLGTGAESLADGLDEISDLRSRAGKLAIYGFLKADTNMHSEIAQRQYDVGTGLESQVESAVGFAAAEIRAVGQERIEEWMAREPRLARHRARLHRILAESEYSAGPEAQAVIESAARWPRISADAFWSLHQSDLGWPKITDSTGGTIRLDRAAYYRIRRDAGSPDRTQSMESFFESLERLQDVFGLLYTRRIEADWILARHRNFRNGMEALWFLRDGMPPGSHRIMVNVTRKNLKVLHRYAALRAKLVHSQDPSYPDLFVQPSETNTYIPLEDAIETTLAASEPIGKEYLKLLRGRMKQPILHLPPLPEKQNTYAIWPPVGGIPPYVIMNYDGSYDSSRRFAGAMTLMMSFSEWGKSGFPDTRDDPGIYSNGMIYVGDILHDDYRKRKSKSREERIRNLVQSLDFLRHHYFQWVLSSEFDIRVEEMIAQGNTPGGRELSEVYLHLLREYYGDGDGGVSVADPYAGEWMLQSVPFLSYEYQFWPAAVALACKVVQGLEQGNPEAARAVYRVLGLSESDRTHRIALAAGIDLSTPEPYLAVIDRMNRLLDELEQISASVS